MTETQNLLTVEMAAQYLHCHPETVRRMIRRGDLRAVKFRKFWRVPMEGLRRIEGRALDEAPTRREYSNGSATSAAAILSGLDSDNPRTRNVAIIALTQADAQTAALVETRVAQSVAEYSGPEDNWSTWRALDGEPFHFPEEAITQEANL